MPIDYFLSSLAAQQNHKAIAVILSGTASDGSVGVAAIKEHGGVTFAQAEDTAKFDMMPRNAIATGQIDFVLSPEAIAQELIRFSVHPSIQDNETNIEALVPEAEHFHQILMLLLKASGIDFRNYKSTTIKRRILRRMMLNKVDTLKNYVTYLINHPKELLTLSQDVFIPVTRFFRDPEVFQALKRDVYPHYLEKRPPDEPLRVWVLGCSTGEEVYSLAINLLEFLEGKEDCPLQFFATDIKESSLVTARLGVYPESIAQHVSPERLKKFFNKVRNGYQIKKSIRDRCVFAKQNVTTDPPFSKLNLISCRNLLIYLDPAAQKRVIPIFHYALKPGGFLLLGQSESVLSFPDLFCVVNKKARIYSKNPTQKSQQILLSRGAPSFMVPAVQAPEFQTVSAGPADIQREADRVLLKRQHHCGVLIDEAMEVIQFRGDTSRYLTHLPGAASLNLLKMVPESIFIELRSALQKVMEDNAPFKTPTIRMPINGKYTDFFIEIIPFKVPARNQRYFLVVFEESLPAGPVIPESKNRVESVKGEPLSSERDLEKELESTRLHLQGLLDDKEAANEELQAANEEILSANEELQSLNEEFQSANEELESAKEELQATNEEITTLNDELQQRNMQLTEIHDDQTNLMNSIMLPVIMVGRDLKIRRFTPSAENVLRVIQSDVGRPIGDLKSNLDLPDLEVMMLQVLNANTPKEEEVRDKEGRCYRLQIRPYNTSDHKIDGAVLTFYDISDLKKYEEKIQALSEYRKAIFDTVTDPLVVLDTAFRVKSANQFFYDTFRVSARETIGNLLSSLGNGQWNIPKVRMLLEESLTTKKPLLNYEVAHNFPGIGHKVMMLNARRIDCTEYGRESILLVIQDMTDILRAERKFRGLLEAAESMVIVNREGKMTLVNSRAERLLGYTREELLGKPVEMLIPPRLKKKHTTQRDKFFETLEVRPMGAVLELFARRKDGTEFPVDISLSPIETEDGLFVITTLRDITERKELSAKLEKSNRELEIFASVAAHDLQGPLSVGSMYLDLLTARHKHQLDKEANKFIKIAKQEIRQSQVLIRDLLDYSKISSRGTVFARIAFGPALRQAIADVERAVRDSGAVITHDRLPSLKADRSQMVRLFQNLISNSLKYRGKKSLKIHISARRKAGEWVFSVKDNGIGIDPRYKDRLFVIFQRAHDKTSKYEGSGIGLAVCKRIVEHHGGKIWFESKLGKGSTFYFTLKPQA